MAPVLISDLTQQRVGIRVNDTDRDIASDHGRVIVVEVNDTVSRAATHVAPLASLAGPFHENLDCLGDEGAIFFE